MSITEDYSCFGSAAPFMKARDKKIAELEDELAKWKEVANDHAGKYAAGWEQGKADRQPEINGLREALRRIVDADDNQSYMRKIAREALEGKC